MSPEELRFTPTHEWVHVAEDDGKQIATVGISAFAVEALTDLVYIELPEVGRQVEAGETICEVESVKAVSDIYAPVAGEIVEVNQAVADSPEVLSGDPYGQGWMFKLNVADDAGLQNLLDHSAYQKQCAEEDH